MRHKGEALILEKMQKQGGCLGFVDMDNLKKINDVYGHKAGIMPSDWWERRLQSA